MLKELWTGLWLNLSSPVGLLALVVILFVSLSVVILANLSRIWRKPVLTWVFLTLFGLNLAALCAALGYDSWGIILALLPPALIVQHAVFLRIVRRPKFVIAQDGYRGGPTDQPGEQDSGPAEITPAAQHAGEAPEKPSPTALAPAFDREGSSKPGSDTNWWRSVVSAARNTSENYFSVGSLAFRYGTSALVFLLVAIVAFFALFAQNRIVADEHLARYAYPAAAGTVGAYVYALLYLGRRNIIHDVTAGGAMWCGISLAAGPVLACAVSRFLTSSSGNSDLDLGVLYFMAGFAPRFVTSYIESLARKKWSPSSVATVPGARTTPLTQIRGITPEIAERLDEEGISDVNGLAMADPLRLIRNTNYDRRLIVAWIDEAILMSKLPATWKFLEEEGVTGAVDLVELVWQPPYPPYGNPHDHEDKMEFYLKTLGKRLKDKDKDVANDELKHDDKWLAGVATMLYDDEQVRRIWVLHNHLSEA
jgi:hypothetical protein